MTPPDIQNGVYRYIFNHMQYMDLEKYRFSFLTKNPQDLCRTWEFKKYGFPVHGLCNVERDNPDGLRDEVKRILREGYDAVHLHTSFWRGFLIEQVAMEMKVPRVIVHSHSTGIDEEDDGERMDRLIMHNAFKEKFSFEYATDVCACSRLAGDWLYGRRIPRDKIRILPNAIDTKRYGYDPQARRRGRREMRLENRVIVGNIGRYCYQKNQKFLLSAFARAYSQNPALFLVMMGQGKLMAELKESADRLGIGGQALFLGWQEHIEEYLQVMDVFCLPSQFEGLAISAVEAQAAGLPCLLSDTITREIAVTDSVCFLPLREAAWAEKLAACTPCELRDSAENQLIKNGYEIRHAAAKLEEFYENGG